MPTTELCRCGHGREAHEHYRRGTDCSICGAAECPRFRRVRTAPRTSAIAPSVVPLPRTPRPTPSPDRASGLHLVGG